MASYFKFGNSAKKTQNDDFLLFSNSDETESCFPSLTYKERMTGFLLCTALGYFL